MWDCESLAATDKSSGREGEEISYLTLGEKTGEKCLEEGGKGLLAAPFLLDLDKKKKTNLNFSFILFPGGWVRMRRSIASPFFTSFSLLAFSCVSSCSFSPFHSLLFTSTFSSALPNERRFTCPRRFSPLISLSPRVILRLPYPSCCLHFLIHVLIPDLRLHSFPPFRRTSLLCR